VRNGMSRDLAELLIADVKRHLAVGDSLKSPLPGSPGASFSH
jgi:hypothetical protein